MKEIQVSRGYVTQVDDEDFEWLNSFSWYANVSKEGYVTVMTKKTKANPHYLRMSRMILGLRDAKVVADHRDRNTLNNCRSNLRIATVAQNNMNKTKNKGASKYKGVYKHHCGLWHAVVKKDGKKYSLGFFKNDEDAALSYNIKAAELFGEFANLNKIPTI